ncbi:MAG: hypothetical protein QW197_02265 [Candidatus Aenigmatarchaeota archaeon]
MIYIATNAIGIYAINEKNEIVKYKLFEENEIEKILEIRKEELSDLEKEFIKDLKDEIIFTYPKVGYKFEAKDLNEVILNFLINNLKLSREEIIERSKRFSEKILKLESQQRVLDRIISQLSQAIEDNEKIINLLTERLRRIYQLYFPEYVEKETSLEKFVKALAKDPKREQVDKELASKTVGSEFSEDMLNFVKEYAEKILELIDFNEKIEKKLEEIMKNYAPNLTMLAGYKLAAKLIKGIGSLEKVAKSPSTRIQLVGAEKALFRFLRGKGKSPKHGYIFIHPYIQQAPKKLRGKVARVLANYLSKAAKLDYFSKRLNEKLKEELDNRIKEILSEKK